MVVLSLMRLSEYFEKHIWLSRSPAAGDYHLLESMSHLRVDIETKKAPTAKTLDELYSSLRNPRALSRSESDVSVSFYFVKKLLRAKIFGFPTGN